MRFTPHRGYGPKLLGQPAVKVKAINQVLKSTDVALSQEWHPMWNQNYDWTGWLKAGVDKIVTLKANTVKITGLSYLALNTGKTAFQPYLIDRVRQYLDYTRSVGLRVYWNVNEQTSLGGTNTDWVTVAVETARILRDYPHVIGVDLWNEPDANNPLTTTQLGTFLAAARPAIKAIAPNLPITVSCGPGVGVTWATYNYLTTMAPYVDFFDIHAYTVDATLKPEITQARAFRASSAFKPYLYGETGAPGAPYFSWPYGATAQTNHYQNVGAAMLEPDCLGAVAFSLTDYDNANFGFYPETFAAARSSITTPFAAWRPAN